MANNETFNVTGNTCVFCGAIDGETHATAIGTLTADTDLSDPTAVLVNCSITTRTYTLMRVVVRPYYKFTHSKMLMVCAACEKLVTIVAQEINGVIKDRVPAQSAMQAYEDIQAKYQNDNELLADALADQPEGFFNSPEYADTIVAWRAVQCIRRLKKITGTAWTDAEGCETFKQRQDKFFNCNTPGGSVDDLNKQLQKDK